MNNRKPFRIAAAAISAAALLTLGGLGVPAYADPGDPYSVGGINQEADNPALINPTANVQLSIHKYLGTPTGQNNDGTELDGVDLPALQGVDFDVYKVEGVDLTTNQGWEAATALSNYQITDEDITNGYVEVGGTQYQLTLADTVTTDGSGNATFTQEYGVGLYLVNENLETSGEVTSGGEVIDKSTITPAAPFMVTLPMTEPTGTDRWMYDVNVYPKNQTDTITKEVEDQGTVTTENGEVYGDAANHTIVYTITTSITDGSDPLGRYAIFDQLDPRLAYEGAEVTLSNGEVITEDTHYTVTHDEETNLVTVEFTEAGLAVLEANRTADVVTEITTTINERGADGIVPNEATFIPNDNFTEEDAIPSPPVESKYGDLIIDKYNPVGDAKLAGAEFAIYADENGDGTCQPGEMIDANLIGTVGPTDTDGAATFEGLQASDFYNNAPQTDLITYCLVETKAPEGFNLDATPRPFTIISNEVTTLPTTTLNIANEQSNLGNQLPLTGGQGIAALSILGAILVGGGVTYYVASNRRRQEA